MATTKIFYLQFATGSDPRSFTGLTPTFLIFSQFGTTLTPPAIKEIDSGWGNYGFTFALSGTYPVYFQADGATSSLSTAQRYIAGVLDPNLYVDQTVSTSSTQITGIVNAIGTTSDSFGTTSTDPGTLYGFLKRLQEIQEGDSTFFASTGTWQIFNRAGNGTTTLLRTKLLTNNTSNITKSGV